MLRETTIILSPNASCQERDIVKPFGTLVKKLGVRTSSRHQIKPEYHSYQHKVKISPMEPRSSIRNKFGKSNIPVSNKTTDFAHRPEMCIFVATLYRLAQEDGTDFEESICCQLLAESSSDYCCPRSTQVFFQSIKGRENAFLMVRTLKEEV
ncbi:hypothetical protein Tco_0496415 [Tanacetum coccineum]|uniref:Uncharacterized protein n=1 Tax=Tanacetum coccineum TaxID=301880 RepID=A0ABQ5G5T9_9ASTR